MSGEVLELKQKNGTFFSQIFGYQAERTLKVQIVSPGQYSYAKMSETQFQCGSRNASNFLLRSTHLLSICTSYLPPNPVLS